MSSEKSKLVFEKINYIIMLAGIFVLALGFFIMTQDSEPNGFGSLGLTVGPIVIFIGFVIEFVAILYKPKKQ